MMNPDVVSPLHQPAIARKGVVRGLLVSVAGLALLAAVAVIAGGNSGRDDALMQSTFNEKLRAVRAAIGDRGTTSLAHVDTTAAHSAAEAGAEAAAKAVAHVNKADAQTTGSGLQPNIEAGFEIATTDDKAQARASPAGTAPEMKHAMAHTSKLVMGPGAFEAALTKKFFAAQASPLSILTAGSIVAKARPVESKSTSKLDMADEGDKDVAVAATIKDTVGDKSTEGTNLTSGEPAWGTPDDMKAVEKVQAAVKAAADAEIDEAVASSKRAAMSSYTDSRNKFLEHEAKNNVTGVLTYSASNDIYHDSNKFVKELKSFKKGGQYLSQRPERVFSVVVPTGVAAGQQFVTQLPSGGEMLVTVPANVMSGQTIEIEVPAAVGPAKSLAHERQQLRSKIAASRQKPFKADTVMQEEQRLAAKLEKSFLADKSKLEHQKTELSLAAKLAHKEDRVVAPEYSSAKAIETRFFEDKQRLMKEGELARKYGAPAAPDVKSAEMSKAADKEVAEVQKAAAALHNKVMEEMAHFDKVRA